MRDEQRPSTTGGAPDRRSRSVADMQELINGLREEQQQAKQALHACQQGMCKARGAIMIMLWNGTERSRLERLFQRWVSAALKVNVNAAAYESGQRRSGQRRRAAAQLGAQLSLRSTVPASADAPARLLESASALSRALAADTAGTERRALALEVSLHAAEVRQQQTEARLLRASRARACTRARSARLGSAPRRTCCAWSSASLNRRCAARSKRSCKLSTPSPPTRRRSPNSPRRRRMHMPRSARAPWRHARHSSRRRRRS
jgi:hypothetical protein